MPFGEAAAVPLGDQRPFFRAKEPEQALNLRISKASSVHGLWIYGICHAGRRVASACERRRYMWEHHNAATTGEDCCSLRRWLTMPLRYGIEEL